MKSMLRYSLACFAALSLTGLLVEHCHGQGLKELEGKIVVDGSSTVAPITIQADNSFRNVCPKVSVPVGVSGTGGGFKRFTKGSDCKLRIVTNTEKFQT